MWMETLDREQKINAKRDNNNNNKNFFFKCTTFNDTEVACL